MTVGSDIYSLGCTLCFLLTGQPPSEGQAVVEALDKYQMLPNSPRHVVVKRVPNAVSAIIRKMTATRPEDRHADLGDVIRDLEGFVGISSTTPFSPREEDVGQMEQCIRAWNESPAAQTRAKVVPAILGACFGLVLLCMLLRLWLAAGAFLSLGVFIALADFVVVGVKGKTALFEKVGALVLGSSLSEWLTVLAGLALLVGLLFVLKLFWIWVRSGLAAIGIATGLQVGLGVHAAAEPRGPLEQVQQMLRSLRLQGRDEDGLRRFVCRCSGQHWKRSTKPCSAMKQSWTPVTDGVELTGQEPGPGSHRARPDRAVDRCPARGARRRREPSSRRSKKSTWKARESTS